MNVDVSQFEMHNVVRTATQTRTRKGLVSLKTPTGGTEYVAGFTIESPFTTEPWHYVFEQDTSSNIVTLRVLTEEFVEMWSFGWGFMQRAPVITYAVTNNQIMFNSPSASAPIYCLVGGGGITAVKTESINADTTALPLPQGHICSFADRMPIAQGNVVFFNDPPSAASSDPRTYVGANALPLPGTIYDIMQGLDGALHIFTSQGVFAMPQDAVGKGQLVTGFVSTVTGIQTSRSHNAIVCPAGVVALTKDAVVVLGPSSPTGVAGAITRIEISPYRGRRFFSRAVEQDDLRLTGELYPTPDGFLVGFRGTRGFFLDVNTRLGYRSYVWSQSSSFNVVGTLRTRDGQGLYLFADRIVQPIGNTDYDGQTIRGVLCGRLDIPEDSSPVIRRIVTGSSAIGQTTGAYVRGQNVTVAVPPNTADVVIGTNNWSASTKFTGRETRTCRVSIRARDTDPQMELLFDGGDRRIEDQIDVEMIGQGKSRQDVWP